MKKATMLMVGLTTATILGGVSGIGHADVTAPAATGPAKIADKDFGRLSQDGVSAFNDVHLARRAIFDGKTDEAAKFVTDAQASLAKAKGDDTVFQKAESALNEPGQTGAKSAAPTKNGTMANGGAPIAWIPVDSEIALGESFVSSPEKAAAVVTARKGLEKGENAKSLEAIRLAQIDINYTVAVAPLDQSIADVEQANSLMTSHDYYGASQALRRAEDGIRYDEIDDVANVKGRQATSSVPKTK